MKNEEDQDDLVRINLKPEVVTYALACLVCVGVIGPALLSADSTVSVGIAVALFAGLALWSVRLLNKYVFKKEDSKR